MAAESGKRFIIIFLYCADKPYFANYRLITMIIGQVATKGRYHRASGSRTTIQGPFFSDAPCTNCTRVTEVDEYM